jgi:outer membrane protein insertion porin family
MIKRFISISTLLFSFVLSPFAQTTTFSYSNPEEFCIKEINITGIKFLDPNVIISLSSLNVGDTISIPGEDITRAIKKLWTQGLFSDINISASKVEEKDVYLEIFLQELPRISGLDITGVKKSEVKEIKELISLRLGSQATENILENSTRLIKKHYRSKSYLNTKVDIIQQNDTMISNGVKLTFDIDKKNKVRIKEITFTGNSEIADRKLRKALKNTKRRDWNIFKSSKFIETDFEDDKAKLIEYYNEKGYRDAKVLSDSIYVVNEKRIGINIKVSEGRKYYYRNIAWVGNTKIPDEALNDILGISIGDVYDKTLLEKRLFIDENSISTIYMDDGYLFFQLEPTEIRAENDSIDIEMRIYEGEQATINKIFIVGNTKTHEHVIRRELYSKPGDLFSKTNITRSIREMANMGHFDPEKLDVKPLPNPSDGTVDLKFIVEEKANDQLEISGGWGGNMFVGTLGVRFSNFAIGRVFQRKAWRPVPTGDSQTLSLRAQTNGQQYKAFSVTFVEPWLGGKKPTNFSVSLYHTVQDRSKWIYQSSEQYMKVSGGGVGLGTRLKWPDDYFTINSEVAIQNYNLKDWEGFLVKTGNSNNFSFKLTLARSSISQPIYPRSGSNFMISLQLTPPYSSINGKDHTNSTNDVKYNWIEYHKWSSKIQWFQAIYKDLVLHTNFQFGLLGYYNPTIGYSPFEGFDLGGDGMSGYNLYGRETIGLRGYNNGSLTPTTFSGVKQANVYNKYTMELRYPLSLQPQAAIYLLVFAEAGNAWYDLKSFQPFNIHRSLGVGARFFLPMIGMLGVDWGYGLDPVPGLAKAHKGQFHFQIGMPF